MTIRKDEVEDAMRVFATHPQQPQNAERIVISIYIFM
jgi:hypothetical protein